MATLGLLVVVAGGVSAATINDIESYAWASDTGDHENTLNHEWVPVSEGSGAGESDRAIPSKGLALVAVNYTIDGDASEISFQYLDSGDTDDTGDDEPEEETFTYKFGDQEAPFDEDGDRVHRAANVTYFGSDGVEATTDADACDAEVSDLSAGTNGGYCWFLIELPDPSERGAFGGEGLAPDTTYNLHVDIADSTSPAQQPQRGENSDPVDLAPVEPDTEVTKAEFVNPNAPGVIETDRNIKFNMTLETQNSSDPRGTAGAGKANEGDVDAWVCLPRANILDRPYTHFSAFTSASDGWDNPPTCDIYDLPVYGDRSRGETTFTLDAYGETHTFASALTRTDNDRTGGQINDNRSYEYQFQLTEPLQTPGSDWIDEFQMTVIVRDAYGNVEYHELDDDYKGQNNGDPDNPTGPGVFKVAEFDIRPDLQQTSGDDVSTFEDEDGCYQPDDPNSDDNNPTNPCFRTLELLPPYDNIEVPFLVENFGNAEDEVSLSTSNPQEAGNQAWDVSVADPDDNQDPNSLTYPIAAAPSSSPDTSEKSTPKVIFDLPEDAVAPDNRTIEVEVDSDRATNSNPSSVFLQAKLAPNPRGELLLGPNGTEERRIDTSPDSTTSVDLAYENTGNTDGPFTFEVGSADNRCRGFNQGNDAEKVDLSLIDNGVEDNGLTISPGEDRSLTVDVDVGRDVPTGEYECDLDVTDTSAGEDVPLTPLDPTIVVEVTGTTNIELLRTTDDADRDEVNVTGQRIHQFADPADGNHSVVLYMENTGDVALEPELDTSSSVFQLVDENDLDATWRGDVNGTMDLAKAASSFKLPATDNDDRERVKISDIFEPDGALKSGEDLTDGDQWTCGGEDGDEDSDSDPRVVCRLEFQLDYSDDNAIIGDRTVYDFRWNDPSRDSDPTNATLDLDFGYPGEIATDSVSDRVVGANGQSSRVVFEAQLDEGRTFDAAQDAGDDSIRADVTVQLKKSGVKQCQEMATVTSSSLTETTARFPVNIEFDTGADCVKRSGNTWTLDADTGSKAVIDITVEDDQGAELRQLTNTTIRTTGNSSSTSQPTTPRDFDLVPSPEMPTNGSQYARVSFSDDGVWSEIPSGDDTRHKDIRLNDDEGVVVSRASDGEDLTPYTSCMLDGDAATTESWTRIAPVEQRSVPIKDNTDSIRATEDISGLVLQQGNSDEAVSVGQIALYGWGDGDTLEWNEGWNPVMLRLVDSTGDPAQPPTASGAPNIDLTFTFAVRNNSGLAHTFELSTQDDSIPLEPMGQGYYRADIYLPTKLANSNGDLPDKYGNETNEVPKLSDHPNDDSASVEYEAWTLHADVNSGESTARQDISGDAYWSADDLGLLTDTDGADAFNGTIGTSEIADASSTVPRFQTDVDPSQDRHEDTRTFVHTMPRFLGGPLSADGTDWVTGPGTHHVGVFMLEEQDDGQRNSETIGDNDTAAPYHEHTFQPVTGAAGSLFAENQERRSVDRSISLNSDDNANGLYSGIVRLPDTGNSDDWFGEVSMRDSAGDKITPSSKPFFTFTVEPTREAASHGIPMPLCVSPPADASLDRGDPDGTAGDFDLDDRRSTVTLDLRSIPGLRPDRLDFAFTPVLESGDDGIRMLTDDDELYPGSTFHIRAPGLVQLDDSLLDEETESGRDLRVRVPVDNPRDVGSIEAWLEDDAGNQLRGPVELTDEDGDERFTDDLSIRTSDEGNRTLVVEATDASGGVTVIEHPISIVPNTAPQVTVISPTGDTLAIPTDGTISFAVDDSTVGSLSESQLRDQITVERATGDADLDGDELAQDNITVTGIDSRVETNASETITVNITEEGQPASGTVYVNVSGEEQFNATLTDGEASGEVSFPDAAGTEQLTVEVNGTDGPNTSFDVEVVEASEGDFSEVSASKVDYTFDGTTVEVDVSPEVADGVSEVEARLTANLTNEPVVTQAVTVQIDDDAPSLTVTVDDEQAGSGTVVVGPSSTVSATASDDLTGVTSLSIEGIRDGASTGSVSVSSTSAQATLQELGIESGGSAAVLVTAEDAAGNEESRNLTVQLDTEPPTVGQPSVEAAGSSLQVTVDVTDNNAVSDVRLFTKSPGDSTFTDRAMSSAGGSTYEAQVSDPGGSGIFEYFVRASDEVNNRASEGSRNTPSTFDLGSVDLDNAAPAVEITAPEEGAVVQGSIDMTFSVEDPEGDQVTVNAIQVEHAGGTDSVDAGILGTALDVPAEETVSVDTTAFGNGPATLTVEVTDAENTVEANVSVEVDNPTQTGGCERTIDLDEDQEASFGDMAGETICVQADPVDEATGVRIVLAQDGQELFNETRPVSEDGVYELPELANGNYDITLTQFEETEDGEERSVATSSASVSLSPPKPVARLVTTIVLGVAVLASTAYAAFGRWS